MAQKGVVLSAMSRLHWVRFKKWSGLYVLNWCKDVYMAILPIRTIPWRSCYPMTLLDQQTHTINQSTPDLPRDHSEQGFSQWELMLQCFVVSRWLILFQEWSLCPGSQPNQLRTRPNESATFHINSLWPSDAIWRPRSGSTLAQVMACCRTVSSHYLNQCWQWGLVAFTWRQFHSKYSR